MAVPDLLKTSPLAWIRAYLRRGPWGRTVSSCGIDRQGCARCGSTSFDQRDVIDDNLAGTWQLTPVERRWFEEREGHTCTGCGMSKRVRMLAWTVRHLQLEWNRLRILHINQINHLASILATAGAIDETCYFLDVRRGAAVGSLTNQDLTALTYPDETFDLVIHSETLEHVFDYDKAFSELKRVLKGGGLHIYSVPLLHHRLTRQRARREDDGSVRHLLAPSYHGLEQEDLVVWEFGGDFLMSATPATRQVFYDRFTHNPTVFAVVEKKPDRSQLTS